MMTASFLRTTSTLPRCEFLEGEEELVAVSRKMKDLTNSEASFGPGGGGGEADLNDNIVLNDSPKKRKRKKEKSKKSKTRERMKVGENSASVK